MPTIVQPSVTPVWVTPNAELVIERAGRVCYKSECKITEDSAAKFIRSIVKRGHESVIEHASACFHILCDRGISHEIVRHRVGMSYSQESTRYVKYKEGIEVVAPMIKVKQLTDITDPNSVLENYMPLDEAYNNVYKIAENTQCADWHREQYFNITNSYTNWFRAMCECERAYTSMLESGRIAQEARDVLPTCLKTEIFVTGTFRAWKHFIDLRAHKSAHPKIVWIAKQIEALLISHCPTVFEKEIIV
jgi:thymidylate synthase (FAD)